MTVISPVPVPSWHQGISKRMGLQWDRSLFRSHSITSDHVTRAICVNNVFPSLNALKHLALCISWHFTWRPLTEKLETLREKLKITIFYVVKLVSLYFEGDIFILMHHLYAPQKTRKQGMGKKEYSRWYYKIREQFGLNLCVCVFVCVCELVALLSGMYVSICAWLSCVDMCGIFVLNLTTIHE